MVWSLLGVVALILILDDLHHPHLPLDQCFHLDHELYLHLVHPLYLAHDLMWVE
jgi:hypothetical protein